MKAVSTKELKKELQKLPSANLVSLCLRLSRFKKENKELLTYLLFESHDEASYVDSVKLEIDEQFEKVNTKTYYLIKKGVRKILQNIKKYSRYSGKKETEVELLIYYCVKLKKFKPSIRNNTRLYNIYIKQMELIPQKILLLHEDLQFDYQEELKNLFGV